MAEPIPTDYLQPDEKPLIVEGRHPLSILDGLFGLTFLILILVAGAIFVWVFFGPDFGLPLMVSIGILYLWGAALLYWRVKTSRYLITPDRVYRSHGRLRFRLLQTTYDKVTDLQVKQSLFGRWWRFGDITVQTAGTGLTMEGVHEPYRMKRHIEEARTAFLARLIEEHRLEATETAVARVAKRPTQADDTETDAHADTGADTIVPPPGVRGAHNVVWRGRPVFASLAPGLFSAGIMILIGLVIGTTALTTGVLLMLAFSAGLLLLGALSVLGVWVQYRYMRYEVADWGVVVTSGWLTRKRVETTYAKVTDVTTYQGIIGRLFDFGNITINTAGSNQAPVVFSGLSQPEAVKRIIDEARQHADRRRNR